MSGGKFPDPGAEIAHRLRLACEAHDPTIAGHLNRVAHYAGELARRAGLSDAAVAELRHATPLHDLGKIGIPADLLQRKGQLTPTEMELMRTHVIIGHRILEGSAWPVIQCAARIALSHHEAWDGTGYPHRVRGNEIPLEARIVSVVDVFDALLSARSYKGAWDADKVAAEMLDQRGKRFEPALLDLFMQHRAEITAGLPAEISAST